jgi:hypothetical protein
MKLFKEPHLKNKNSGNVCLSSDEVIDLHEASLRRESSEVVVYGISYPITDEMLAGIQPRKSYYLMRYKPRWANL